MTTPTIRQFFANLASSFFNTKYATSPPIIPKNIGKRYHQLLLDGGITDDCLDT